MVLKKKIAIFLVPVILISLALPAPVKAAAPFTDLVAQAALLVEADTGTVLYERNKNVRHPADSLAKVMTMILALSAVDNGEASLGEIIEMTESALFDITSSSSTQKITVGEQMAFIDLLYCAFVGSANEACNLIAEYIAGSVEAFVALMNDHAGELGCERTHFTNPHGQYDDNQYTTAFDQYMIYSEAIGYPLFEELSGTFRHTVESTNKADARRLNATNSLLNSGGKYYYRPCTSGLASITYEGGHSFAGFAESDGLSLIVIVLGSDVVMFEDDSAEMRNLTEARRLFEWGFSGFGWRTILSPAELVGRAAVEHGAGADYVNLRPDGEIRMLLDNDIPDKEFIRTITIYSEVSGETLTAPVQAGEVLGELTVTRKGEDYGTVLLVANTSIELHRLVFMRMQIAEALAGSTVRIVIWILVLLVAGYAALVIRYNVIRIRRVRRINETKRRLIEERYSVNETDTKKPGYR